MGIRKGNKEQSQVNTDHKMKLIFIFLLISVPSNIFCKFLEYGEKQDCAFVLEKFLGEFSNQVAEVKTKQDELAKENKKQSDEVNVAKLELADVKFKYAEKLAEVNC